MRPAPGPRWTGSQHPAGSMDFLGLGTLRYFQWLVSLVSYALFESAFRHVRSSLGLDVAVHAVPYLNAVTVVYSTLVIIVLHLSRRLSVLARFRLDLLLVLADLLIAGVFLAKAAILNSTRLDCQVLLEEKFFEDAMTGEPISLRSLSETAFGLADGPSIDEIDRQCAASLLVYWISVAAIISYVFSTVFTLMRLKDYRRLLLNTKKLETPGNLEMFIEAYPQYVAERISSTSSFRSPGFPGENGPQERHCASELGIPIMHRPRSSQESSASSSCSGEKLLASDVFWPADDPPLCASKEPSLVSLPR